MSTVKVEFEHTDTFAGEANYSWCNRVTREFNADVSEAAIIRAAKSWAGLTGVRCKRERYNGDTVELRPQGHCSVLFIVWRW